MINGQNQRFIKQVKRTINSFTSFPKWWTFKFYVFNLLLQFSNWHIDEIFNLNLLSDFKIFYSWDEKLPTCPDDCRFWTENVMIWTWRIILCSLLCNQKNVSFNITDNVFMLSFVKTQSKRRRWNSCHRQKSFSPKNNRHDSTTTSWLKIKLVNW